MRNILIILFLTVFCSYTSCNSNHYKTDSDSTIDEEDIDISDDLSDDLSDEVSDTESEDTEPDETPDIVYPEPTCIEIYEGDPESKLCFGPVKTDVKCNGSPEDNEFVTVLEDDNPTGKVDSPMDINDDFVFFPVAPEDPEIRANIYGCNRKEGLLYEIVTSKYNNQYFSVDGNLMVFIVIDSDAKLFLGNLKTNDLKEINDWGSYGKPQLKYPFVVFPVDYENPFILNLETNESKKLSRLTGPFPRNDGKNLVLTGYYKQPGESDDETPFGIATWIVDMKTFETRPLNVTATIGEGVVNIDGDYAMIGSGRDLVYYGNFLNSWSGMDIYSLNLKTKREEKWTPEIKGIFEGNITKPSFEYPYFHFIANETEKTWTGKSLVLNIETGETTELWPSIGDEWMYIKDRHVILGGYYRNGIAKL
ncbi:MAG TPA: hypothetical protein PKG52_10690, partial [bacterium]|nr:hypothetical protein [bacterium]